MIIGKALKNYIERMILQKIGINSNDGKIRKLENDIRGLRGKELRMAKEVRDIKETLSYCKCKKKVGEENA